MDIENNSIVTDVDTEVLDSQIAEISNEFAETYCCDEEDLEMLVAKAMKLGELYERKKWQAAKAQAVPEGFVLIPKDDLKMELCSIRHLNSGEYSKSIIEDCVCNIEAMIEAQEPANDQ